MSRSPVPTTADVVPAPKTGVYLGSGRSGPVTVRLVRPTGTRVADFSGAAAALLLTLRAAVAGTPVHVMTDRQPMWTNILRQGRDAHSSPLQQAVARRHGPLVLVDDRPTDPQPIGEAVPWQCRIDVRTAWNEGFVAGFGSADVAVFPMLPAPVAEAVGNAFGLGDGAGALLVVPRHSVAVVTRGQVKLVRLDPTTSEAQLLRQR